MSAATTQPDDLDVAYLEDQPREETRPRSPRRPRPADGSVVVRRNAGLAALVGAAASAVAIAYLWRATESGVLLDWVLCLALALVAGVYLATLVDARTPLLVADELGVRIRLGHQWRGLPWDAVDSVAVSPRPGRLRDGRLVFRPQGTAGALEGLDARGRRAAALNRRMYGAALAVPLGLTTRVPLHGQDLADRLAVLSRGAAEVVVVRPESAPRAARAVEEPEPEPDPDPDQQPVEASVEASVEEPVGKPVEESAQEAAPRRGVLARLRLVAGGTRRTPVAAPEAAPEAAPGPGGTAVRPLNDDPARPDDVRLLLVPQPAAGPGTHVEPVTPVRHDPPPVAGESAGESAGDPVIGPELAAARVRVGLSVDELAERTRIRPHVIESIEVDDFTPCGGDFYARGHLRTLARVLGRDPAALLEQFDRRYATAPVDARRVFEAELATGMTGSMRSTTGGANWPLLAGVVLVLVVVWGVVRLFDAEPPQRLHSPIPSVSGAAGAAGPVRPQRWAAAADVRVAVEATRPVSSVVVRDRDGKVAWAGSLGAGTRHVVRVVPPVHVRADDAGAVEVSVAGRDRGTLGPLGSPGRRTFHRP